MKSRKDLESEFRRISAADVLGRDIEWYESLESTNIRAKELAAEKTSEGTIVVADEQTAGRGRLGRDWFSPEAQGLWFSVVLYPTQSMAEVPPMTIMVAKAVKDFLNKQFQIKATIKEPNDLLIKGKKVCGILAEASTKAGADLVDFVVIGIGLNLKATFPEELAKTATSVADHAKDALPPRTQLLAKLVEAIEERYLI